jgi:hypothetical protein
MGCLGVHFALNKRDLKRILNTKNDEELLDIIQEDIEERDDKWSFATDKAWDAIHRCLTNGKLEYGSGPYPLSLCILGGKRLYQGDDYITTLIEANQVVEVAKALKKITKEWMRERYFSIDKEDYGFELSEEDFEYTWDNFEELPKFFEKAARAGRAVIFTAEQ